MLDWLQPWITPGLLIALFAWLRADLREIRGDVKDLRDRLSRLEGRIDGWQDQRHPAPAGPATPALTATPPPAPGLPLG